MKLLSYPTILRDDWRIRVSLLSETGNILVVMYNIRNTETIVRSFLDEIYANLYIEYIMSKHLIKDQPNE